jgi:Amt family ammonium transporter
MGWWMEKRPSFVGIMIGAVAGLATITPAAGYVSPASAVLIGIIASFVCYFAVVLKNRLRWDDALDVWGVHGVGGALGTILLGVFATKAFNAAGSNWGHTWNLTFFGKEIAAAVFAAVWSFALSYGMLWVIDYCTTVRVTPTSEESGLDQALHGETAYIVVSEYGSIGQ